MLYTLVVGGLCILATVAFVVSFLSSVRLRPLSSVEATKPLVALANGQAVVGQIVICDDGRRQTQIIMPDGSVWFTTFGRDDYHDLALLYVQSPDFRRGTQEAWGSREERFPMALVWDMSPEMHGCLIEALTEAWQAAIVQEWPVVE
jgi:hypothetical protein